MSILHLLFCTVLAVALLAVAPAHAQHPHLRLPHPDSAAAGHNRTLAAAGSAWAMADDNAAAAALIAAALPDLPSANAVRIARDYRRLSDQVDAQGLAAHLAPLHLPAAAEAALQQFFTLPDTLDEAELQARVAQLQLHLAQVAPGTAADHVLAIAQASARYWAQHPHLLLPDPARQDTSRRSRSRSFRSDDDAPRSQNESYGYTRDERKFQDSIRRVRRNRIVKADAGGLLKGILFGLFHFGAGKVFLDMSDGQAIFGSSLIAVALPAVESFGYARKLRRGWVQLEDDPWWGPPVPGDPTPEELMRGDYRE